MALPATISSVAFPGVKNNRLGPFYFSSDDDLYLLLVDSSDNTQLEMHKSSDNGDTWAAQGTNPDTGTNQIMSVWGVVDGTTIHVAVQEAGGDVSYFPFNTSTDAWGTLEHGIQTPTTTDERCSIAVRSDGDIAIFYQGPEDRIKGTDYQRIFYTVWEGSSWSTPVQVDDGGSVNYRGVSAVLGASDKIHIFYEDDTNNNLVHKSLTSGNSLSSAENCNDNATSGTEDNVGAAVYYDAAGTERITVAWRRSSDGKAYSAEIDNDGTPGAEEAISDASLDTATTIPPFLTVGDGDIVYAHFTNTDRDIYHDENDNSGGWGTDVETLDAVTVEHLYGNTFVRSSATIFGYLYDDSGTVKYNEYELIAGGTPVGETHQFDYNVAALAEETQQSDYNVRALAEETQQSDYNVKDLAGESQQSDYNVKDLAGETQQSDYNVAGLAEETQQSDYNTRALAEETQTSTYDVFLDANDTQQSDYNVRDLASETHQSDYNVAGLAEETHQSDYNVRDLASETHQSDYNVAGLAEETHQSDYNVAALAEETQQSDYNVRDLASETQQSDYNVAGLAEETQQSDYNTRALAGDTVTSTYDVAESGEIEVGETHQFDYSVAALAEETQQSDYNVAALIADTLVSTYDVFIAVDNPQRTYTVPAQMTSGATSADGRAVSVSDSVRGGQGGGSQRTANVRGR